MNKFVRNLITEWRRLDLPFAGETVLVAVSGGADSVGLALALKELYQAKKLTHKFVVAHFNHDLRGAESQEDAEFVKSLAAKLEFEFVGGIQNPNSKIRNQKGNLEQTARQARYDFLAQAAQKQRAFVVLTAHTLNDQAETFLLNLVRGSGSEGLSAMPPVRKLNEIDEVLLARPLLGWALREMTEDFCRAGGIEFRRDPMNEDLDFSRVRVRKQLIPFLREFNPKIVETLARTANLLRADAAALEEIAVALFPFDQNELSVKELKKISAPLRRNLLRAWLKNRRGDLRRLEMKHLEAVERLVFSIKSGRAVELPAGEKVIKSAGKLVFEESKVEKSRCDN